MEDLIKLLQTSLLFVYLAKWMSQTMKHIFHKRTTMTTFKGTVPQNMFSLKSGHIGGIDL